MVRNREPCLMEETHPAACILVYFMHFRMGELRCLKVGLPCPPVRSHGGGKHPHSPQFPSVVEEAGSPMV